LKRALLFLLVVGCSSSRPAGVETPVTAPSSSPERSLMRIRATSGEKSQSFRAQLHASPDAMLLTAYTPLGTSAFRLYASGDRVVFLNDVENTTWSGTPAQFASSFGFFGDATPVAMAQRILGQTRDDDAETFPPKHVTITRGPYRLEIEHLESVYTTAPVEEPKVPRNYRCCVPPRL
jgi:hypothetical protein